MHHYNFITQVERCCWGDGGFHPCFTKLSTSSWSSQIWASINITDLYYLDNLLEWLYSYYLYLILWSDDWLSGKVSYFTFYFLWLTQTYLPTAHLLFVSEWQFSEDSSCGSFLKPDLIVHWRRARPDGLWSPDCKTFRTESPGYALSDGGVRPAEPAEHYW